MAKTHPSEKKRNTSPTGIFEAINKHEYEDLLVFMNNTDWYSIAPEYIIPRDKIRGLVRLIADDEVRLDVMRYLDKYALDYFKPAAEQLAPETATSPIFTDSEIERQAIYLIGEFQKELRFQIDLIESSGKYTGQKFSNLNKKIQDLENEIRDLKEERQKLHKEIAKQKAMIDELEHPERKHQVPNELQCEEFYHIITYLTKKGIVEPQPARDSYYRSTVCYHWNTSKVLFGYFVCKICYLLELRTKDDHLIWKPFKLAFENFGALEKQARDHASKNKNWGSASSTKPDDAYIVDEALQYCAAQMELSRKRKG